MVHSDPISDMLTRIRNGAKAGNRFVDLSLSRQKLDILNIFHQQGFIDHLLVDEEKRKIRVFLRYGKGRKSLFQGLRRISKPSLRYYVNKNKIPIVFGGLGIAIISTSQGVLDGEAAKQKGIGGELICSIW